MILEHALLDVIPGQAERFEKAFSSALPIISSMPGCRSVRLERCVESPSRYLMLVEWDRLEGPHGGIPRVRRVSGMAQAAPSLLRPVSDGRAL